jgi:sortase family protein
VAPRAAGHGPPPAPHPEPPLEPRRPTVGLLLAILLPAAFTFVAGALIFKSSPASVEHSRPAAELAALAERQASGTPLRPMGTVRIAALAASGRIWMPLQPLEAQEGRAALGPLPLESVGGGIRPAPPQRISIPAAKIDAEIRPVSTRGGTLSVPPVGVAGWYAGGPRPGEYGHAVIIGHLDTKRGPGLFAEVPKLKPGAIVSVIDRRGELHRFSVVGTAEVHKDRFPAEQVYGSASAPVLVLVTCGGEWRGKARGYRDNILLYARAA